METFHSSIMPAEMSVVDVMIASNSASEPEAISASLRLFTIHHDGHTAGQNADNNLE